MNKDIVYEMEMRRLNSTLVKYRAALEELLTGAELSLSIGKDVNAEWVIMTTKKALKGRK